MTLNVIALRSFSDGPRPQTEKAISEWRPFGLFGLSAIYVVSSLSRPFPSAAARNSLANVRAGEGDLGLPIFGTAMIHLGFRVDDDPHECFIAVTIFCTILSS